MAVAAVIMPRLRSFLVFTSCATGAIACNPLDPPPPGARCERDGDCLGDYLCRSELCVIDAARGWDCPSQGDGVYPCLTDPSVACSLGRWSCSGQRCEPERPALPAAAAVFDEICTMHQAADPPPNEIGPWFRPALCQPDHLEREGADWVWHEQAARRELFDPGGVLVETTSTCADASGGWCATPHPREPVIGASRCEPTASVDDYRGGYSRWTFEIPESGAYRLYMTNPRRDAYDDTFRLGSAFRLTRVGERGVHPLAPPSCVTWADRACPVEAQSAGQVIEHCVGLEAGTYALYMYDALRWSTAGCGDGGDTTIRVTAPFLTYARM